MNPINCKECGAKACICHDEIMPGITDDASGLWAAHCMDCDNTTGKRGYYHAIHEAKEEATSAWNELNKKECTH